MKKERKKKESMVEVARSFTFKVNIKNYLTLEQYQYLIHKNQNVDYQSQDFFASQKVTCPASKADEMSEAAYQFCKKEVTKAVNDFIIEYRKKATPLEKEVRPLTKKEKFEAVKKTDEFADQKHVAEVDFGGESVSEHEEYINAN